MIKELEEKAIDKFSFTIGNHTQHYQTPVKWVKLSDVKEAFEKMMPTDEEIEKEFTDNYEHHLTNGQTETRTILDEDGYLGAKWLRDNLKNKLNK